MSKVTDVTIKRAAKHVLKAAERMAKVLSDDLSEVSDPAKVEAASKLLAVKNFLDQVLKSTDEEKDDSSPS